MMPSLVMIKSPPAVTVTAPASLSVNVFEAICPRFETVMLPEATTVTRPAAPMSTEPDSGRRLLLAIPVKTESEPPSTMTLAALMVTSPAFPAPNVSDRMSVAGSVPEVSPTLLRVRSPDSEISILPADAAPSVTVSMAERMRVRLRAEILISPPSPSGLVWSPLSAAMTLLFSSNMSRPAAIKMTPASTSLASVCSPRVTASSTLLLLSAATNALSRNRSRSAKIVIKP